MGAEHADPMHRYYMNPTRAAERRDRNGILIVTKPQDGAMVAEALQHGHVKVRVTKPGYRQAIRTAIGRAIADRKLTPRQAEGLTYVELDATTDVCAQNTAEPAVHNPPPFLSATPAGPVTFSES